MKTAPITPAAAAVPDGAAIDAAFTQARQLLGAHGLPARWRHRHCFVILQVGFGWGTDFLAAWQAWRSDPERCQTLCVLALEPHPPTRQALQQALLQALQQADAASAVTEMAQALVDGWPELTPNVHAIDLDGGRVQLLLAFGPVQTLLPALRARVDAFHLRDVQAGCGGGDARWPKALARQAAADATLTSTDSSSALCKALTSAGFAMQEPSSDQPMASARYAPRATVRQRAAAPPPCPRDAIVIGAGIAGAAMAQALARNGVAVRVFDRHAEPAQEASGNPAGLFHGTVHAADGVHARLFRAAALHAPRAYADAWRAGVPGDASGLLRLAADLPAMQALLLAQRLPPGYVRALDADSASQHAGVPLSSPAWLYPGGGWLAPAAWIGHQLRQPGVAFVGGMAVARIAFTDGTQGRVWHLHDAQDRLLAQTRLLVLANAADAARLLHALDHSRWPMQQIRGQVTWWTAGGGVGRLRVPLAGDGYAIPLHGLRGDGGLPDDRGLPEDGSLLCGATRETTAPSASAAALRPADHLLNVQGLQRLTGLAAPDTAHWQGRVGWRLQADDRLPIAGAVPLARIDDPVHSRRLDQPRLLPRQSGLFVLTALGARGLTLAPLLARLVAAQATGAPWPLEQDLADAIDPGRWIVRAARGAGRETSRHTSKHTGSETGGDRLTAGPQLG